MDNQFESVMAAFKDYSLTRSKFIEAMRPYGIVTRNIDPIVDFAEIVVAHELRGQLQGRVNKEVDVITTAGVRVQVKSLRVSRDRPDDNCLTWHDSTRRDIKTNLDSPLIEADLLAVVIFRDAELYAMVVFPIIVADRFPALDVKDLLLRHVDKLL